MMCFALHSPALPIVKAPYAKPDLTQEEAFGHKSSLPSYTHPYDRLFTSVPKWLFMALPPPVHTSMGASSIHDWGFQETFLSR